MVTATVPADSVIAPLPPVAPIRRVAPVPIAGMTPLTLIDYPGHLSAVLFLQGCPWRCPYCHNPELQPFDPTPDGPTWPEVRGFLRRRVGRLDAVVFSGGEPTAHEGLAQAMREVREFGYSVGLHTNGCRPDRVEALVDEGLIDWVGIDVKAPRWLYGPVTGVDASAEATYRTLRILRRAGVDLQARVTVYRPWLDDEEVARLAVELRDEGLRQLSLQPYRRPADAQAPHEDLSALQRRIDAILQIDERTPSLRNGQWQAMSRFQRLPSRQESCA